MSRVLIALIMITLALVAGVGRARVRASQTNPGLKASDSKYEGQPIASLEFSGNEHFISDFLKSAMLNGKSQQRYSSQWLQAEMERLQVMVFFQRGFLRVVIGEPQIEEVPEGIRIVVPIAEGRRYTIGKIVIERCTLVNGADALEILGLKEGEIANRFAIDKGLEKLRAFYGSRGYVQFSAYTLCEFTDPPGTDDGIADLTLNLDEGRQYLLRSINFIENPAMQTESIRKLLLIQEGEPCDTQRIRTGVQRINDRGFFEPIRPGDINLKRDDSTYEVDVYIPLKEKPAQR